MSLDFNEMRRILNLATQIASDISTVAAREESLVKQTLSTVDKSKESLVLQELAKLSTEKLRDASDSPIRVETLKRYGLTNMASIYRATHAQLSALSGISDDAATLIKEIADDMFTAISKSTPYGMKAESLSSDDLDIVTSLHNLANIRQATRGRSSKMAPVAAELKSEIALTNPLNSRLRWAFSGKVKKARAMEAVAKLQSLTQSPATQELAESARSGLRVTSIKQDPEEAAEDFAAHASDYFSLLEDVTDSKPSTAANRHLNQELLDLIEAQEFDSSLIKATLRKYQLFGAKFALTQNRVIIGDEMGLGKTIQAVSVMAQRELAGAKRFLVVAPASVLVNWVREIQNRSDLKVTKIHAGDREESLAHWIATGGIGITTFDTLKTFGLSEEDIAKLGVDTVIVDEAHYVKNPLAGRTRALQSWLQTAPRAVFLTGTPLENRVEEFINLARLLDPAMAGSLDKTGLVAGAEVFRTVVAPIYLRRNTEEVLKELPDLIEVDEYCSWDGVDPDFYKRSVGEGNFMGMRRAGFVPLNGEIPNKLERIIELVEESFDSGQKVIVFSFFTSVIELLMTHLGERAMGPITGSVSPTRRQQIVDDFMASADPKVLVGQIQAAGTGLNIQGASVVILCEPQIKPSLEVQAIARAHRMGQVRTVRVHRMIIPNSVDEEMQKMLARKQAEFDAYVRDSELANSSDSAKDIDEESLAKVIILAERERLALEAP
jgi:SNF2 family DNA or RNA helicase